VPVAYRCHKGILQLRFAKKSPPFAARSTYKYEESSKTFLSSEPTLMDPLDHRNVYIRKSGIPNSGEGTFAKRTILPDEVVMLYAGVRIKDYETDVFRSNMTRAEREDAYKNTINNVKEYSLNVPPHMSDIKVFRATLGHKVRIDVSPFLQNDKSVTTIISGNDTVITGMNGSLPTVTVRCA
jgi:hypothetical protein